MLFAWNISILLSYTLISFWPREYGLSYQPERQTLIQLPLECTQASAHICGIRSNEIGPGIRLLYLRIHGFDVAVRPLFSNLKVADSNTLCRTLDIGWVGKDYS